MYRESEKVHAVGHNTYEQDGNLFIFAHRDHKKYMKYSEAIEELDRLLIIDDNWIRIVKEELDKE